MSTDYHPNQTDRRSVADLVRELRDETTGLLREEVALAKTEMQEKVSRVGRNTTTLIIGGAVAHLGLIFLLLAATGGLEALFVANGLPVQGVWLSPLIVGLVVGGIGLAMLVVAKNKLKRTSVVPEKTVQTLKDDKRWAQEKIR